MRYFSLPAVFLLCLGAIGCSEKLKIELINDTGARVLLGGSIAIESGESGVVYYPGDESQWRLSVSVEKCRYAYRFPRVIDEYPWSSNRSGKVQFKLDERLEIHILSPDADHHELHASGFPLVAEDKTCV